MGRIRLTDPTNLKIIYLQNNNGDLQTIDNNGNEVTINGVKITSHGSRHNRGGPDPIDWSSVSRYRNASGSGTIGVKGSPATILELSVSTNYYNLLPLLVSYSISGLGTGETFTLTITAVLDDGSEVTLYSASGLNAGGKVTIADLDFTQVGDTKQIRSIRVKAESSATSTSATLSATVVALET